MDKLIKMTEQEMRAETAKDRDSIIARAKAAPEFEGDPNPGGKSVARGFAAFKEYINRKGRPKAEDPKVSISIRIPLSKAAWLRGTGPGWQTRTGNIVVEAIDRQKPELRGQA
jgi:uncharacterized protein (DUF4415 family)